MPMPNSRRSRVQRREGRFSLRLLVQDAGPAVSVTNQGSPSLVHDSAAAVVTTKGEVTTAGADGVELTPTRRGSAVTLGGPTHYAVAIACRITALYVWRIHLSGSCIPRLS